MWKKFLSVMALVAVVGTTSASAVNITPIERQPELITGLDVDFGSIIPSEGMEAEISFNVVANADNVELSVMATGAGANFALVGSDNGDRTSVDSGATEVTFFGREGNTPNGAILPQGSYAITLDAKGVLDGDIIFQTETINVRVENASIDNDAPRATAIEVDQREFDPRDGEATGISFDLTDDAYVILLVEDDNGDTVRSFEDFRGDNSQFRLERENPILVTWDGKDDDGNYVADGNYRFRFVTYDNNGANQYIEYVTVATRDGQNGGVISDVDIQPSRVWNPEKEDLEIEVQLDRDVKRLLVRLEKNGREVVEIADELRVDDNEIVFTTDRYDDDGDELLEGVYTVVVIADADRVETEIEVAYEDQEILEAYLSKEEFDPSQSEVNYLIFKSGVNSNVTIELYKGNQKELTYLDDVEIRKNRLYALEIDGMDRDGDELVPEENWRLKITAENQIEDDVYSTEFVSLIVKDDEVSDRKANATNDTVSPVIFDDRETQSVDFEFCVDENNVTVDLQVFEDFSTSGSEEAELLRNTPLNRGCHTVTWEFDGNLDSDTYTYKLVVESEEGRRDTEIGRFAVGSTGTVFTGFVNGGGNDDDVVICPPGYDFDGGVCTKDVVVVPTTPSTGDCGGYWDTNNVDAETCEAIAWVTSAGIFNGYADGSFGPYNDINRAEALKVILNATNAPILPVDGSGAGFIDVNPQAWYMPFIRTAKIDGFIEGYATTNGQEVRADRDITRVEFLKLVLEAAARYGNVYIPESSAAAYYGDVMPGAWYNKYAAMSYNYYLMDEHTAGYGQLNLGVNDVVQRREVALALYRMYNSGLLN